MAEGVRRELFAERIGSALQAPLEDGTTVTLEIAGLEDFGQTDGRRFSVFLTGPGEVLLPQGTYQMSTTDGETAEVFIVPIARDGDRLRYEAAFNRDGT